MFPDFCQGVMWCYLIECGVFSNFCQGVMCCVILDYDVLSDSYRGSCGVRSWIAVCLQIPARGSWGVVSRHALSND